MKYRRERQLKRSTKKRAGFFEVNKINKPLATVKKKKRNIQINKNRNREHYNWYHNNA